MNPVIRAVLPLFVSIAAFGQFPGARRIQGLDVKAPLVCSGDGDVLKWVAANNRFECLPETGGGGGGDASTNTSTSVDSEIALFVGTGGKTLKRATTTGIPKLTSGVLGAAVAGTDYENPLTFTAPLSRSVNTISCVTATGSVAGCLSAADWTTFNNKQSTITNITQITNRAISDTTGDLASGRIDDGNVAITNFLASGATGSSNFRAITDADVPNSITIDLADTATALATNPANCSAGNLPRGITEFGVAEGCASVDLASEVTGTLPDGNVSDTITLTNITQITNRAVSDTTGTLAASRGGLGQTAATEDGVPVGNATSFDVKVLPSCSNATNDKLLYNSSTNAFSCGTDQTGGAGSGITTLNTLTGTTQTFSKTDDTNVTLALTPSGTDHNFALGWTGTLAKARQNANTLYGDAANTLTEVAAPGTPASGFGVIWVDSTDSVFRHKNDAGTVSTMIVPSTAVSNQFMTGVSALGAITRAQPAFTDISGAVTDAQVPDSITVTLAATATALATGRTIGGVTFDGTANIVPQTIQMVDAAADTTTFPLLATSATGSLQPATDPGLSYNASTNELTATTFIGNLTGNVTGNASGTAATITGLISLANTQLTTRGDLLVANTATPVLARLPKGTQYQTLQGGAADLLWDAVHLDQATAVTGLLPAASMANSGVHTGDAVGTFPAVTLTNIPTAVTMAGYLAATAIAAPGTPAAGIGRIYVDSTAKNLAVKDDAGVIKHGVQTRTATASNWIRAIDDAGATTISQPDFTDLAGSATDAQIPDTITASNYLALSGGTLTGLLTTDNLGIEFEESNTNPTCASGNYNIYADLSEVKFKKCTDGVATDLDTGAPGGSTTQIQYNNAGALAGMAEFTYATSTITGNSSAILNMSAGKVVMPSGLAGTGLTISTVSGSSQLIPDTSYFNGLYDQTAASVTRTAGATMIVADSATTEGLRLVGGTRPSAPTAGALHISAAGAFEWYDGSAWNVAGSSSNAFSAITGSTNTSAAMVVGSGASLRTAAGIFGVPASTTLPGTCTVGDAYMDTDATSGARWYLCESTNTWAVQGGGSGSGTINSGVTNVIPKYTASTTIDDSLLSDDGTTLTYSGTGGVSTTGTAAGSISLLEASANGSNFRKWLVPDALTASLTMTFPNTVPTAGQVLTFGAPSADVSTMAFGSLQDIAGAVTDAQVPNTITVDLATVATTANAGDSATSFFSSGALEKAVQHANTVYNDQANTWSTGAQVFTGAILRIPNSTTLPGTCTVGDIYMDTDATTGQRIYACQATDTWALQGDGGSGGGGSVFTGSTATNPAHSATPTFSLADVSVKSPMRVEPGAMTANVTSVTFTNKTAGAKFSIAWTQDGTGGRTVAYGASASNTCTVDPTASATTTQFFEVGADGTTVNGTGCIGSSTATIRDSEQSAPGTPAASTGVAWFDSTNHVLSVKANNSATVSNTVVPDTGTANNYISAISAAGVISKSRPSCATLSDSASGCSTAALTLVGAGSNGIAAYNAGDDTTAARSDHTHRHIGSMRWYFPGTPSTGLQPMVLAMPTGITNAVILNVQATANTPQSGGTTTLNVARCTTNCTIGGTTTPVYTDVYATGLAMATNKAYEDCVRLTTCGSLTSTLAAGDRLKANLTALGTAIADITVELIFSYENTN